MSRRWQRFADATILILPTPLSTLKSSDRIARCGGAGEASNTQRYPLLGGALASGLQAPLPWLRVGRGYDARRAKANAKLAECDPGHRPSRQNVIRITLWIVASGLRANRAAATDA